MLKSLKENIKLFINNTNDQSLIEIDLGYIHLATSLEIFNKGYILFAQKWDKYPLLLSYIKKNHIDNYNGWFVGYSYPHPCTNNAIEGTNRWIKDQHFFRQKLPIESYMTTIKDMIGKWSIDRNQLLSGPVTKFYESTPNISTKLFDLAKNWESTAIVIKKIKLGIDCYYTSPNNCEDITISIIQNVENKRANLSYTTFYEYVKVEFKSVWKIILDNDNLYNSICTCPKFYKKQYVSIS